MPLSLDQLIAEQLKHLRDLTASQASRAMSGDAAILHQLFETQRQLVDLMHYQVGYQTADAAPLEAPPPLMGVPAPPLRPRYDADLDAGPSLPSVEEDGQRTAVTWPPDPLFGPEDPRGERDAYEEER